MRFAKMWVILVDFHQKKIMKNAKKFCLKKYIENLMPESKFSMPVECSRFELAVRLPN